ncbi:MAG: hypothetical protein UR34_C0008G0011 [candidate division WS6 bacterium GW2011_GWC1_33_20]|nr:MAG: hypothetical protein UR32_C0006G0022 [candidate division WS6 bacterium GW2011_GWE2_33_157]KKP43952.1 MAG: hypothetical protein UR34_C0008G0011 [candidate division WS6 bacterium GW2011_GWC1_33_20]KKP45683.1 MAG: hypothetical protein UR36_C0005G0019 [candidate division WS6 bacterium GW2011_GWF1_33_233]KKP55056.1 MAG: hypothetical protein UR45_C0005G0009 [candidate division WS6 bacterium GW2011_WS6_33_547]OGC36423.1 MAG: hypothetical protein A2369_01405 [candidate division WS6 bacterium RI
MTEPHYKIDCIDYQAQHVEYLEECGEIDTRLAKVYKGDGQYMIIRPPSLEDNRRLDTPPGTYNEIANDFGTLLEELKTFDINVPDYQMFVSDIHTAEGHYGKGLCIASDYIHGKCLPLEMNGEWNGNSKLFYKRMEQWLYSMSMYMSAKYLSSDFNNFFLSDVCRPIQFVYSFDNSSTYLVDLDPLYNKVIDDNGKINERFLIGINTLSNVKNRYFNKGYKDGFVDKKWGEKSRLILGKLVSDRDFENRAMSTEYSKRVLKNLKNGLRI